MLSSSSCYSKNLNLKRSFASGSLDKIIFKSFTSNEENPVVSIISLRACSSIPIKIFFSKNRIMILTPFEANGKHKN